jgi:hypothetical protein
LTSRCLCFVDWWVGYMVIMMEVGFMVLVCKVAMKQT